MGPAVLRRGGWLCRVRDPVPHDRVDHLQSLSGDGLQGLPVAHAAIPAAAVVLSEPAFAAAERVAGEDEQVLQPPVPLAGRAHRRYRPARLPVPRRDSAVGRKMVMVGKVADVYVYHQLGCGPGADSRNGEQAA